MSCPNEMKLFRDRWILKFSSLRASVIWQIDQLALTASRNIKWSHILPPSFLPISFHHLTPTTFINIVFLIFYSLVLLYLSLFLSLSLSIYLSLPLSSSFNFFLCISLSISLSHCVHLCASRFLGHMRTIWWWQKEPKVLENSFPSGF